MIAMVVVVLGALIPILIPLMQDTATDIAAMQGTPGAEPEIDMLVTLWPIMLLILIIGVAAGVIFFALKHFGVVK